MKYIKFFNQIQPGDGDLVGGKIKSLGLMVKNLSSQTIRIPDGFAITSTAYWHHIETNRLLPNIKKLLESLDISDISKLNQIAAAVKKLIIDASLPKDLEEEIGAAYKILSKEYNQENVVVAVRSSATAEDLPEASFAGQQDSFLNVKNIDELLFFTKDCMASLFNARAISYRVQKGFGHFDIGICVGVQKMVRSDLASSGVMFTLDTETGFKNVIEITSSFGLGEAIVQGKVNPDEYWVAKPQLIKGHEAIIKKELGSKELKIVYSDSQKDKNLTQEIAVSKAEQDKFSLSNTEIIELAKIGLEIENFYTSQKGSWSPMDIEWAKDGIDNKIYVVQARSETIHAGQKKSQGQIYKISNSTLSPLLTGLSIGQKIASGKVKIMQNINNIDSFEQGDILVTQMTDPDWVPLMKRAGGIITNRGGRTCHAAIVSRELGIPAIVGANDATTILKNGQLVTIDCSQGKTGYIYDGKVDFTIEKIQLDQIGKLPFHLYINVGDPDGAFNYSFLPVDGVGLARMEFIISSLIKIHPQAAINFNSLSSDLQLKIKNLIAGYETPEKYFIEKLTQGIATICAAFYPKPVILRLSDFKTNEYRNLIGGQDFEPIEENPMLGYRGAFRYCYEDFAAAFALECRAINNAKKMGFDNLKILVPFVRTLSEAKKTLKVLEQNKICKSEYEIIMMCEVPSNVILIDDFCAIFDGFSIGSNDLTQLTLGVDRDSSILSKVYDENDKAVKKIIECAIAGAHRNGKKIGICGQGPSDLPEFAKFLIDHCIDSISLNPDSVISFLARYKY